MMRLNFLGENKMKKTLENPLSKEKFLERMAKKNVLQDGERILSEIRNPNQMADIHLCSRVEEDLEGETFTLATTGLYRTFGEMQEQLPVKHKDLTDRMYKLYTLAAFKL